MPNPLYQQLTGGTTGIPQQNMGYLNPIQKASYIMNALTNPAQFVKQQFPDVPDQIINDPQQILNYLQKTRGISNQQIQSIIGGWRR